MIDENPYAAGEAPTRDPAESPSTLELAPGPVRRPAGDGFRWISAGFSDFGRGPFAYVGFVALLFVAMVMISLVANVGALIDPIFGAFVNMATSIGLNLVLFVFAAGFLLAVHQARAAGQVRFDTFLSGFQHPRFGALLGLGGLYMLFTAIIAMVIGLSVVLALGPETVFSLFESGGTELLPAWMYDEESLVVGAVVLGAVLVIIGAGLWMLFFFATHLVTFSEIPVFEALKRSFIGCLKNILPLFLWSIVVGALTLLGTLPCGLGLLVVVPTMWASTYQAFVDIFTVDRPADSLSAGPTGAPTI